MKINWKVRAKNPIFWFTLIPAVISAVYGVLAVIGIVPRVSESTLISAFTAVIGLLSALGIVADPTTAGVKDSDRAMNYEEPYSDERGGAASKTITFKEFVKAHLGRGVDVDGAAGVQCVDLIKAYLKECFGIKAGSWGNARYYYESFNDKSWGGYNALHIKFERIANTPDFVPDVGDICVFGKGVGSGAGHVSIANGKGDTSSFYSYDQNWYGKPMKEVQHRYNSEDFLGVIRPKQRVTAALNVRAGAGTEYKVVDELPAGSLVAVYYTIAGWAKIGDGKYVSANYLERLI